MRTKYQERDPLLDENELARILKVNRAYVFGMHLRGRIPGYRLGQKSLRFRLSEVLAALANQPHNRGPYKSRKVVVNL
jgi:predicted DNA-binding transcriptional regulator AlpA